MYTNADDFGREYVSIGDMVIKNGKRVVPIAITTSGNMSFFAVVRVAGRFVMDISEIALSDVYTDATVFPAPKSYYAGDDGAWIKATLLNGVTPYNNSDDNSLRYRKIGNMVFVRGLLAVTDPTPNLIAATLPAGFRPAYSGQRFVVPMLTVGDPSLCLWMHGNGNIYIYGGVGGSLPTGNRAFHTDFSFIADA